MSNTWLLLLLFPLLLIIGCNPDTSLDQKNDLSEDDEAVAEFIKDIPQVTSPYKHKVMVLGTFHFDRDRDGSDVVAKNHLDITTEESQHQIESLVNQIASEFKPTMIAVEWMPAYQPRLDSLYNEYKNGQWALENHEAFQIGFRLAKQMGLSGVHCVDNRPPQPESVHDIDDWDAYAAGLNQEVMVNEYNEDNNTFNQFMDDMLSKADLIQYLKLKNSPEHLRRYKQFSFTGLVNLGYKDTYVGADFTGNWYRRNTRILVNIRNLSKTENERVLVIYGAAHKWVLDELFDGSPEFEVVQPFM